ncbi:SDR family NAD(P)-dependent oxidoreductase [Solimonas sp. SE-A11]|uniref:SDR family NAD(P)-dependent oxidoreductase n=1 Tax=Solimonas sp. SE-A11 TaxID=3054954 RepID=UPI00259CB4EE|nr:SDR family NAD(P)-dependent oxidoreductase [Solimonas sp. SE-A11]MDM4771129.1 SDR family NAD(P)-dependent oxidoreductase [Solimonas sp. SE-A11]
MLPENYQPAAGLLKDRVILVTGAGEGLGKAAALAFARHGATVVLLGRTVKKLEATYDAIEKAGGPAPAIYPMNLGGANWNDHGELANTLGREFGRLDGVLHCAAHFKAFARLQDVEPREWIENLQVNLTAAFAITSQCLPLLEKSPDASVVFCSDRAGREARPFHAAYGVAKAGLENLSRVWALETADRPQLRFNTYCPPPLRTGLRQKGYPGEVLDSLPLPDSVTPQLLWLMGPDSRGQSGKTF